VLHEEYNKSDHRPLVIDTEYHAGSVRNAPSGPRKFEAKWLREEGIETIIQTTWERAKAVPGTSLAEATKEIQSSLNIWDREVLRGPRSLQRGRIDWLKLGDQNTFYFHNFASHRKKSNRVKKLMNDSGMWIEDENQLAGLAEDYFTNLFNAEVVGDMPKRQ
jgi:hypothetical protein